MLRKKHPHKDQVQRLIPITPPHQWTLIYREAPYYLANPASMTTLVLDGARSCLNPYEGPYTLAAMMSWGQPIVLWPSVGMLSPVSSGASTDRGSIKDYPEIEGSTYWNPIAEALRISMVGPTGQTPVAVLANI
jgi:hypothetical protein